MNRTRLFLLLGLAAAYAMGSSRKRQPAGSGPHFEPDNGRGPTGGGGTGDLPVSDQMLFDSQCRSLIVKVDMDAYDKRITNRYWELRQDGWCNPTEITAEILRMDAPQCAWPPAENASEQQVIIWEGTHQAIVNYMTLEDPKLHESTLVRPCF